MTETRTEDLLEQLSARLAAHRRELARFHVRTLELFGSRVRGEAGPESDIDILVTFEGPVDLFTFLDLERYLRELLGHPVDLLSRESLKPAVRRRIEREAVRVF